MSRVAAPLRRPAPLLYSAVLLIGAFELAVIWQALHPMVPDIYRGYYIDRTTTCLNQPQSGAYAFGRELSFRAGNEALIRPLLVCGWEGPAGDGLHAIGESSRLHFVPPEGAGDLELALELVAVDLAGAAGQAVEPLVNGASLGIVHVATGTPQRFAFTIPADAVTGQVLDLELRYPEAILVSPRDSDLRKRSIKLSALRLGGAD